MQHKKRGRPRLRDDQGRFDPSRFSHTPEATLRRPLAGYGPAGPSNLDDSFRRATSYRVLKSQPVDNVAPRFLERGPSSEANVFPAPLSIATRAQEPAAFLTMELEIVNASTAFVETIGMVSSTGPQDIRGRKLPELIAPQDREKVEHHQRQMQREQMQREPNYLPPIYGKQEEERVIQSIGFAPEDLARFQLDRQDLVTFVSSDGQQRSYAVQLGLAKVESTYFIVLLINVRARQFPYPSPSPHTRDVPYSYPPQQAGAFSQPTPISASFDPSRQRPLDVPLGPRKSSAPAQMISGLTPGMAQSFSPTAAGRGEYPPPGPSYQVSRNDMPPTTRPPAQQEFQLPPIRNPSQSIAPLSSEHSWPRDDRSNRVDIGGLIEKPADPNRRPTQ